MFCLVAGLAKRLKVLKGVYERFIVRLAQLLLVMNLKVLYGPTVLAATVTLLGSFLSLLPCPRVARPVATYATAKALVSLAGRKFFFASGASVGEHFKLSLCSLNCREYIRKLSKCQYSIANSS